MLTAHRLLSFGQTHGREVIYLGCRYRDCKYSGGRWFFRDLDGEYRPFTFQLAVMEVDSFPREKHRIAFWHHA